MKIIERLRRHFDPEQRKMRRLKRMSYHYPTSAWIAQFESPEELRDAIRRGERPPSEEQA